MVFNYLESSPTDAFLTKEIDRLENRLGKISIDWVNWMSLYRPDGYKDLSLEKKEKKTFEKDSEVPKFKLQVKALTFILNQQEYGKFK